MTDLNYRKENLARYQFWVNAVALLGILISCTVIIGWILRIPLLLTVLPDFPSMKKNTAVCILTASIGIALLQKIKANPTSPNSFKLFLGFAALVLLFIGTATLFQHFIIINLGIDNLFLDDWLSERKEGVYPGRMNVLTAASFVFFGISFVAFLTKWKHQSKIMQTLLLPVMLIASVALISFVYGITEHSKMLFISTMAVHTAGVLFLLSIAGLFIHNEVGLAGLLSGKGTGNTMARKVMLRITMFALAFGFFRVNFFRYYKGDEEFSIVFSLMLYIFISCIVIWFTANEVNDIEAMRDAAELDATLMQSFIKQAPSSIAAFDTKLRYIAYSKNWVSDYHLEGVELLGKSHYEMFPEIGDKWKIMHQRCLAGETIHQDEDKFVRADNNIQWLKWEIRPWHNTDGSIGGILMFSLDITKTKAAEEARIKLLELEAKNRELEQFTYIASHDLQEPLKTISNFSAILNTQYSDRLDDNGKQILNYISESAVRMTELVKGLLFYARIGSERKLEEVDFNEAVKNVCKDLASAINEKQAQINVATLPVLPAYKMEINQLFQNLISNAIKFCEKDKQPIIHIHAKAIGKSWEFVVQDNGIGIAAKDREKAFVLFKQLHNRGVYAGTGIGLAYCKKIVELHAGSMRIEDATNGGTVFYFTINPIQYEEA